jgi:predicted outer membrane repeat protein
MNSMAKLDESNLIRNSATNGGGIYNAGSLTVDNSFMFENTAVVQGGGIYNVGTATVTNTRQVKNKPDNCFGC